MTKNEFYPQVKRMNRNWKFGITPERVQMIWSLCSHLSIDQFYKIISDFIASHKYMPMVSEFRDKVNALKRVDNDSLQNEDLANRWTEILSHQGEGNLKVMMQSLGVKTIREWIDLERRRINTPDTCQDLTLEMIKSNPNLYGKRSTPEPESETKPNLDWPE